MSEKWESIEMEVSNNKIGKIIKNRSTKRII